MTPHSNDSGLSTPSRAPSRALGRGVFALIIVGLLAAGAAAYKLHSSTSQANQDAAHGGGKGGPRATPVIISSVKPGPFAIVLEGLGTVTPLATVTVKTQVDGRLITVGYKEGAKVRRGQLLAEIDPRPFRIQLEQANATLVRDRAQQKNAQLDLDRYTNLRKQNLIAEQQLTAQQAVVDQGVGTIGIDQAMADNAALQLDYTRITSPIDGVAGIRQVDAGNLVHQTDTGGIVVLTQLDPISVVFTLPQDELPRLAQAMEKGLRKVTAVSRGGDQVLGEGELTVIDNQVSASTATVRLKAQFANPQQRLWPLQFVRARIEIERRDDALALPAAAIQQGPNGTYVYVVNDKNIAQMRPVTIDVRQAEQVVISSGVHTGDRVIIDGGDQLKPNSPVKPRAADAVAHAPHAHPNQEQP
jgi:multidrug efflux system membrane fusion protein